MTQRTIEKIVYPGEFHYVGDGFHVHNYIPGDAGLGQRRMDPFVMLDYNPKMNIEAGGPPRGVGAHPHRGFETVTVAYKGEVAHHDSHGGGGVIGEGDVQWMTAAAGVLHKEYYSEAFAHTGGVFQMVQLWVNLPSKDKMAKPRYQAISKDAMGSVVLPDNAGSVAVIAGSYHGQQGPALTFSPIHMLSVKLNAGGSTAFAFPSAYTTFVVAVEGAVHINTEQVLEQDGLALMANDGEQFEISAGDKGAVVLVLSGEPLQEPIASYGPFVMNTKEEIMEAIHDFNHGKFGYLE